MTHRQVITLCRTAGVATLLPIPHRRDFRQTSRTDLAKLPNEHLYVRPLNTFRRLLYKSYFILN